MSDKDVKQDCQLVSAKQLAKMLSLSVRSVWRLRNGRLPEPVKVGGSIRWRQADIEKWIKMGCPRRDEFERFEGMMQ